MITNFPDRSTEHWTTRHRGPFRFLVARPSTGKTPIRTAWLPGEVHRADVDDEAMALLTDPRDGIISISVWSVTEQQYVWTYRKDTNAHSAHRHV